MEDLVDLHQTNSNRGTLIMYKKARNTHWYFHREAEIVHSDWNLNRRNILYSGLLESMDPV